jgi:hypothetical protein
MRKNTQQLIDRAVFETLEGRQLQSATILLQHGVLNVTVDANTPSTIKVQESTKGNTVNVYADGTSASFKLSQVKSVSLTGSTQSDYIYVDPHLGLSAQIAGNGGNDTIWGGAGLDHITTGAGNDLIHGHGVISTGSGNDTVWGSNQGDTINCGSGNDLVVGGTASNVINGGAGLDTLIAGPGSDKITAGTGDNVLYGSGGATTLTGGTGADTIYGGTGPNVIVLNSTTTVVHAQTANTVRKGPSYPVIAAPATPPASPPVAPPVVAPVAPPASPPVASPAGSTGNGPTAVITQLENSIIAGEGVEVNAINSTNTVGSALTTLYKWDFGDPGSQYNDLTGWNAGHVYSNPGTYTITLQLTDSAGNISTATSQVTVNADNRTIIYVDTNGSDSNTGLSPSQAVKTADEAFALAGNSTEILFCRGETFTIDTTLWIKGNDQTVGAYGAGANPVLMFAPTDGATATIYVGTNCANTTIENLTFDSPNAVTTGEAGDLNDYAVWAGGTNLVVSGNTFDNVEDAVNGTKQPSGVIVQNNSAPLIKGMRGYLCWVDGNNWSILGNTVVNSTRAHDVRVNGSDVVGVLIADNNLTKQYPSDDPGEATKDTVDVRIGAYVYVAQNVLSDSPCGISPSPGQTTSQIASWVVFDGNFINNGQLDVDEVGQHVMIRNNVLNITGTGQITVGPTGTTVPGDVVTDLTITHNTGINTGQDGEFITVSSEPAPGSITIDHNVYSAPNLRLGYGWDSAVWINAPDMTGFASITDNIWPTSTTLVPNVVNYFAGATTATGYVTEQGWNSLTNVSNDQYSDEAMPTGNYQLTINGVTAGATNVALAA